MFKPKRHPQSLLKEGVSTLRHLADASQNIFRIIMPWRAEQEEEEKRRERKRKHEAEIKQQSLMKWVNTGKGRKNREEEPRQITKEEEKYQQQTHDGELDESAQEYARLQKVIKVKEVQRVRLQDHTQNAQAILINPKWRPCDHFSQLVKLS